MDIFFDEGKMHNLGAKNGEQNAENELNIRTFITQLKSSIFCFVLF
jgi:hypothetical protein